MISLNITILFQFVNFVVGLIIINHFIIKPIREVLAKRRAIFDGLETDVNGLMRTSQSKLVEYDARLQKTRQEITQIREDMKTQAAAKAQELQNQANDDARSLRQEAQDVRAKESGMAFEELQKQTQNYARLATSRLLS